MLQQVTRVLIGATAAAALVACGGQAHSAPPTEQTETPSTTAPASTGAAQPDADNQGLLKAGATAQAAVNDSTVVSLGSELSSTWDVEVVAAGGTEYRVEVSYDGTIIVSKPIAESGTAEDDAAHRSLVDAAKIDYRQAVAKATQAVPGTVMELKLASKNGSTVWEAKVHDSANTSHRVVIDAGSGEVVPKN